MPIALHVDSRSATNVRMYVFSLKAEAQPPIRIRTFSGMLALKSHVSPPTRIECMPNSRTASFVIPQQSIKARLKRTRYFLYALRLMGSSDSISITSIRFSLHVCPAAPAGFTMCRKTKRFDPPYWAHIHLLYQRIHA